MSNIHTTKETAISVLSSAIASMNGSRIYVGITQNLNQRKSAHEARLGITINDFTHVQCQTATIARAVEKHFTDKKTIGGKPVDGDTGGGDSDAVYVYAFSR